MTLQSETLSAEQKTGDDSWDLELERQLWADICLKSFWWFLVFAVGLPKWPKAFRWWQEYIHKPIADWFQSHVEYWLAHRTDKIPQTRNLMLLIPREYAKTTEITQCGQLWLHLQDANLSTYAGSENVTQAQMFLTTIKTIVSGGETAAYFTWLYGDWVDPSRAWRNEYAVHGARTSLARKEPSFGTWGVETGLTSRHIDAYFFDDPTSYDSIMKDSGWLDKVNSHLSTLIPVLNADGLKVWVGTRYADADHYGTTLGREGIATLTGMPMSSFRPSTEGRWHVYYLRVQDLLGNETFPEQWPKSRIDQWRDEDPIKAAAQLDNDPSASIFNPLTRTQVENTCYINHEDVPWDKLRFSVHCDTAFNFLGRQSKGDWSVVLLAGHHPGTGVIYYVEGYGDRLWTGMQFNKHLVGLLLKCKGKLWPVFAVTDELDLSGHQGSWEQNVQTECHRVGIGRPNIITLSRGGRSKAQRLSDAATYWVRGLVKIVRNAPGAEYLVDQMTHLTPLPAHDDWADAFADALHPKIYIPIRREGMLDTSPNILRPHDDMLMHIPYNAQQIRRIYDESLKELNADKNPYGII